MTTTSHICPLARKGMGVVTRHGEGCTKGHVWLFGSPMPQNLFQWEERSNKHFWYPRTPEPPSVHHLGGEQWMHKKPLNKHLPPYLSVGAESGGGMENEVQGKKKEAGEWYYHLCKSAWDSKGTVASLTRTSMTTYRPEMSWQTHPQKGRTWVKGVPKIGLLEGCSVMGLRKLTEH